MSRLGCVVRLTARLLGIKCALFAFKCCIHPLASGLALLPCLLLCLPCRLLALKREILDRLETVKFWVSWHVYITYLLSMNYLHRSVHCIHLTSTKETNASIRGVNLINVKAWLRD